MSNPFDDIADGFANGIDNAFEGLWRMNGQQWKGLITILLIGGGAVMFILWWMGPSR